MEFLIGLVVIAVVVLFGGWMLGAVLGIGLFAREQKTRATATENASAIANGLFNGAPVVTYNTNRIDALSAPEAVAEGIKRGYSVAHDAGGILTFRNDGVPAGRTPEGKVQVTRRRRA